MTFEAGAGTGDENHLLGIHDHPSLWRYRELSLMPEAKQFDTWILRIAVKAGAVEKVSNPVHADAHDATSLICSFSFALRLGLQMRRGRDPFHRKPAETGYWPLRAAATLIDSSAPAYAHARAQ